VAKSQIEAGRYLVTVAGCNDCHTAGWLFAPGKIPESEWLTGSPLGWNGPWGTSYGRNLRRSVAKYTPTQWIQLIKSGTLLPPMPAENLKDMSNADFEAIYAYIKSLGVKGEDTPANLPPGATPTTPYINMMPVGMDLPHGEGHAPMPGH
jgi:mono/diheme cytochrome c family protein